MLSATPRGKFVEHGVLAITTLVTSVLVSWFATASAHVPDPTWKLQKHIKKRVKRQIGEPYAYGGSSPGGFDCSGLTGWVFRRHGADLPHSAASQYTLAGERGAKRVWKRRNLKKGDLVFFDTTSSRIGHAGIYIGKGKFVSATSSRGVRKESVWDPYYWGPRYVAATRLGVLRNER